MKQNWTYKRLGDCFPYIKNGANIKQEKNAKGYPITRIETLAGGVFNRDRMGYANIYELSKYADYLLSSRDLLMSHINSKAYIGRTVEYVAKDENEHIIHGMNLLRIKSNNEVIDSSFFVYYTHCHAFTSAIAKIRKDAVNQSSFSISDLKNISIPLPPLATQSRIVSELDLLQSIIDKQQAQLKELDTLAQAIFYDMFGDPVENEKGWEVKRYSTFASVIGGYAFKSDLFVQSGIPVLKIGNINTGKLKLDDICFYPYTSELSKYEVHPGDIVISLTGTTGKEDYGNVCYISDGYDIYYLNQRNTILKPFSLCNTRFLQFVFGHNTIKRELTKNCHGIRQANILNKDILNLIIPLPPLSLQQSFASKIESIEKQKATIAQSIAETQKLFNYTMDKYFG